MPKMTGAFPCPRHRLAAAVPFAPITAAPACWGVVAPLYRMWGNDQYGVCVTSEEAANIANFAAAAGLPSTAISDGEVIRWARKHGFLNGANLPEVMDALQAGRTDGLLGYASAFYVGPYRSVDWHDRAALCGAIYESQANVNIGIASAGVMHEHTSANGWMVLSCPKYRAIDHCVGLCGYGTLAELCAMCGVRVPGGADGTRQCYLLYTWGSVGIVSEEALWAMTGEAWVRRPSSIADPPYPAPTPPTPPTPPAPPVPPGPGPLPPLPPGPGPEPVPPTPEPDWIRLLLDFLRWFLSFLQAHPAAPKPQNVVPLIVAIIAYLMQHKEPK